MTEQVKKIPLDKVHRDLGAKMVPFAGFDMPVRYTSDKEEHLCVREKVGLFDVSHMGEFELSGAGALDFLQKMVSNDVSALYDGKIQYACLMNEQGGVVDDLLIYKKTDNRYFIVVNASNIDKDFKHFSAYLPEGLHLTDLSEKLCLFAVQGPLAVQALSTLTALPLSAMEYYTFVEGEFAGVNNVLISSTGYTGAGGFEIYVSNEVAERVFNAIMEAGKPYGILPIGLGARDTLRLEMGFCLYGHELTDATTPLQAGLARVTKFNKNFLGKEVLEKQKAEGLTSRLGAFIMRERGIPRADYEICTAEGEVLGKVTSGGMSPLTGDGLALAYVPVKYTAPGAFVYVKIRDKLLKAESVKLPFISQK